MLGLICSSFLVLPISAEKGEQAGLRETAPEDLKAAVRRKLAEGERRGKKGTKKVAASRTTCSDGTYTKLEQALAECSGFGGDDDDDGGSFIGDDDSGGAFTCNY